MNNLKKILIISLFILASLFFMIRGFHLWSFILSFDEKKIEQYYLSDYHYYHYAFENVWEGKDHRLLYDCDYLQTEIKQQYNIKEITSNGCYLYPPQFAVFLSWFGILSFEIGDVIWKRGLSFMFLAGIYYFTKTLFPKEKPPWLFIGGTFLLAITNFPHIVDIYWNNANALVFLLLSLMFYFLYYKKSPFTAGILLGIATVFKITPIVMLCFYIVQKRWKMVWGFIFSSVMTTIITIFIVGWDIVWKFVTTDFWELSSRITVKYGAPTNSSIYGVAKSYIKMGDPTILYLIFSTILLLFYLWWFRKQRDSYQEIILISISSLIFSLHLEVHHMILAFFTQMILLKYIITKENQKKKSYWVVTFINLFICFNLAFEPSNIEYFFTLIALFITSFLIKKKKEE